MQDSKISTSMPVLDLIDAIQPGSIKYDLLKTEDLNDEEKLNNAKYVHAKWHLTWVTCSGLPDSVFEKCSAIILIWHNLNWEIPPELEAWRLGVRQ